jgi:hypothetical protein
MSILSHLSRYGSDKHLVAAVLAVGGGGGVVNIFNITKQGASHRFLYLPSK